MHITIYATDEQQGPTVWHMEQYLMFYNNLQGKRI